MTSKQVKLTKADAVEIMASVIEELRETGLRVGVRNAPETDKRQSGVLIFVEGVSLEGEGFVLKQ